MEGHQQGWCRHHDELQSPETNLGDGEEVVEAGILASGLLCVAHKILLFIFPDLLGCCHVHQDPEQEDHREPDPANDSGVLVHPTENVLQKSPVHCCLGSWQEKKHGLFGRVELCDFRFR
uniref:Uncharacterized protein n=1 Tax=Fundulus heteroclitus TaxID=8078 RepID=A0A3Q2P0Z1_FUNHE